MVYLLLNFAKVYSEKYLDARSSLKRKKMSPEEKVAI
jgi:hypothetical protein